jgi:hypothetical protein
MAGAMRHTRAERRLAGCQGSHPRVRFTMTLLRLAPSATTSMTPVQSPCPSLLAVVVLLGTSCASSKPADERFESSLPPSPYRCLVAVQLPNDTARLQVGPPGSEPPELFAALEQLNVLLAALANKDVA